MTDSTDTKSDSIDGDQIPWYRWRWFFLTTFVVFYPLSLIVGLTGDVYCNTKGEVSKLSTGIKLAILAAGALVLAKNFFLPDLWSI
ncbi:hypothetical protein [Neptunomonas japonica]|uniref:Uncharacterized protein n=1 Tax=Neptunomonas japonica JAMM 1380 TaxID=1441457 RepID=A0A7R6SVF5_9GAMM|nr:hypothetical protein [Neptunomonas japonica]BBB29504.1 conserved hypothetical protein [Neptunomonas japonica JAMM 1380]